MSPLVVPAFAGRLSVEVYAGLLQEEPLCVGLEGWPFETVAAFIDAGASASVRHTCMSLSVCSNKGYAYDN